MNLNAEDPLKIQVKLAEDPIKIQIHMPETPVIRVELGAGPQGRRGEKGDDYVLTEEDKDNIAELAADKLDLSDYAKKTDTVLETTLSRGRKEGSTVGTGSVAFGNSVEASGENSLAFGNYTYAVGNASFVRGSYAKALGNSSSAEGSYINALGIASHAEGGASAKTIRFTGEANTVVYQISAYIPVGSLVVNGKAPNGSFSIVTSVEQINDLWYATLDYTLNSENAITNLRKQIFIGGALGDYSHSEGLNSIAFGSMQHAEGRNNEPNSDYAHIVGNGFTSTKRSNAYALDWEGNGKYAGDVYVHSNPDSSGGDKLATEDYVDDAVSHISSMTIHICTAQEYDAQTGIPTITNPDATTFYLVPGGDAPNLYIEWIYTNNAWEQFGSASIDLSNYVQKTDYATSSNAGVVKISGAMGIDIINGFLTMATADHAYIQDGTHARKAIPPKFQHESAFYGLAKAAGDITQSQSSNPVGTYTDEAKAAIKQMLGVEEGLKVVRLI